MEIKAVGNENEYKRRMMFEYRSLVENRLKLEILLRSDPDMEKKKLDLLHQQLDAMLRYEDILMDRLLLELGL